MPATAIGSPRSDLGLGNTAPTAVAVSPDGTRAYVTHRTPLGAGRVSVINTANNTIIATVNVGSSPQDVAVSPLDNRVYVANNASSSVSVINTAANNSVSTINVGSSPQSLAVSPDKSVVLVARSNDNVAVIDTKTNTVIGTQHLLDTTAGDGGGHIVAFSPDGRAFVTDAVDRTVRVVGLARGNTAPFGGAATVNDRTPNTGFGHRIGASHRRRRRRAYLHRHRSTGCGRNRHPRRASRGRSATNRPMPPGTWPQRPPIKTSPPST